MNNPQPTQRSLTGIVTKLVGDGATYGFINDEIFFPQTNVVSGGPASVGDQVFAECEYSAHLPIKWNATSVKILNKAAIGVQNQANSGGPNQQQQFNQAPPVADTYLQHRRQQRQLLDTDSRPENKLLPPQQQQQQQQMNEPPPTGRLLDQTQPDFFAPPGVPGSGFPHPNQPQMQQQQDAGLAPFQNQPMDGANFTFTSQPGSAFVQNQFLPPPFLPQQGPPMLAQSQHLLPQNNQASSNQNQRNNMHGNKGGGNRFGGNNMETKNDRQQNRNRNQSRNNENNRMRSGDREGPTDRSRGNNNNNNNSNSNNNQNQNQNQNQNRNRSRDRSTGRGGKKEAPSRPTPPPQSSARSTTSSDRVVKSSRRHYEPQNIPKTKIMTNMNAYNMKLRCPASVHVPSDLKDIIVNKYFRLDIKNTPKPLRFIIEEAESGKSTVKKEEPTKSTVTDDKANDNQGDDKQTDKKPEVEKTDDSSNKQDEDTPERAEQIKSSQEQQTPPSSKSDIRLNHKYGVKIILISLPELDAIYRKVFGTDLDSFTNDNSKTRSRLDDTISLLCNKGSNNGHSLIGGKFDPILDGFVEGKRNRFERHARHPDLIATCKRVVLEQTGLDLGPCRSWSLLSTFIYNNKTDYFSSKASIEYSFIYMPQIWTMLKDNLEANIGIPHNLAPASSDNIDSTSQEQLKEQHENSDTHMQISLDTSIIADKVEEKEIEQEGKKDDASEVEKVEKLEKVEDEKIMPRPATQNSSMETPSSSFDKNSIYEMKRDDLKLELDKRNIKYKLNAKKGELLLLLEEVLKNEKEEDSSSAAKPADGATVDEHASDSTQLEEGEVVENDPSEDSKSDSEIIQETEGAKRKADDDDVEEPQNKRICTEQEISITTNKDQRVELVSEAFFVKSREQQQLSLVSLYEASQSKSRHDQFELSVASNILKESLIQHLSEYILTTLVEDNRQNLSTNPPSSSSLSSSQNQQESSNSTGNDANNNNNNKSTTISRDSKVNVHKEYPVDRYINLAFSYFDSTHMGYVYSDDLNKLFNNTDLTISKRALASLIGDSEKFIYRTLADLSPKLTATYIYEFPEQFRQLPPDADGDSSSKSAELATKMIEYKGVVYDIERLTQEVKDAETLRVSMVDRFNYAIENSDKQTEEIHVLEVSQKSLSKAIKSQNDEICDLKRERDSIKKKYDSLRKAIKGSIGSLSDLIKEDK